MLTAHAAPAESERLDDGNDPVCTHCGIDVPAVDDNGLCARCAEQPDDGDDFSEAGYRACVGLVRE